MFHDERQHPRQVGASIHDFKRDPLEEPVRIEGVSVQSNRWPCTGNRNLQLTQDHRPNDVNQ